jgi:hypothetical protein
MRPIRILMVLPLLLALNCGGRSMERGIKSYTQGDYTGAAETFDWVEQEKISLTPKSMVRYMVYRGLTAYHLGKMAEAKTFLGQARAKYEAGDARWLAQDLVKEMDSTLDKLGQ